MHDYAIFVQARLGSTRLPKKVLREIRGKRILDYVLDNCIETGHPVFLLVPRTEKQFFNETFWYANVFGGSELDVLERFYECAVEKNVKNIVRITSDCVCLSSEHIVKVIETHRTMKDIFVSNVSYEQNTYVSSTNIPDGFDVEIFNFDMLKEAHENATKQQDREHVTPWMRSNFTIHIPKIALSLSGKYSIDTEEDIQRIETNFDVLRSLKTVVIK